MSNTLDSSGFTTVWNDNFTQDSSLNSSLFPIRWGAASEFSFGANGLTLTSNGAPSGFMNSDQGAGKSTGYGLYQATFTMPPDQSTGAYICLWPSTNQWPGPELDFVEQLNGKSYCTVHWMGSNGSNQFQSFFYNANLAQPTTVALDWEANSLTFYVNGRQVVQYLAGGAVPIPKDYADGGENESFGIGNVGPAGTTITVSDLSYSVASAGSAPAPVAPVPSTTIALSATGSVQEASPGAGVTTAVTISDPGLSEAYALVMNANNVAEENWVAVPLNSAGQGTMNMHFEQSGDYVLAVSNPTTQTDRGLSNPITITHSTPAITKPIAVSNPGIQFVSQPANGATVPITLSDPGLKEVYAFVMNAKNVAEQNWIAIPLNAAGTATYDFHFKHTGDYVLAVSDPATGANKGYSASVVLAHN